LHDVEQIRVKTDFKLSSDPGGWEPPGIYTRHKLTHIKLNKFLKIVKKFTQLDETYSFELDTIPEMDGLVLSRKCTR
jgi:hypothetical protein